MKMMNLRSPFEVKSVSSNGVFSGYGAMFGNTDSYGDIIAPGAFVKSLSNFRAKGRMPAMLWQHDSDKPIGVWTEMREDARGLYVEGKLLVQDVPRAKEAHALLKAGALSGMSIGFMTVVSEWDKSNEIRTLKEIDLWEVSLVTFPANDEARVSDVKSVENIETVRDMERFLREKCGLTWSCAKAFMVKARTPNLRDEDGQKAMGQIAARLSANTSILARKAKE